MKEKLLWTAMLAAPPLLILYAMDNQLWLLTTAVTLIVVTSVIDHWTDVRRGIDWVRRTARQGIGRTRRRTRP